MLQLKQYGFAASLDSGFVDLSDQHQVCEFKELEQQSHGKQNKQNDIIWIWLNSEGLLTYVTRYIKRYLTSSQLAKMEKSIPDMSLP